MASSSKKSVVAINPSKSKYDQYLEEIKQRESKKKNNESNDDNENIKKVKIIMPVDRDCKIKNVRVFEDYSVSLIQTDITYGVLLSNDRFYKMQLLEKSDKKKWLVWVQTGKISQENPIEKVNEHLNKHDAMAEFEKKFFLKTGNKWIEKGLF